MGGKKADKNKEKSVQQSTTDIDDENKLLEPHTCNGHFMTDIFELCRREKMTFIPPVVPRPRRPPSPTTQAAIEARENKKGDKNKQPIPEPEPEPELNEGGEPVEPPPKTYVVKDNYEYSKPRIQVEQDHPDKQDTVTEVYIRGWKLDELMMTMLTKCFVTMEKLHTINLWNTGLTSETLSSLAECLSNVTSIKALILDNNPVIQENYHLFLREDIPLQTLVLRHNKITDVGASKLGEGLGNVKQTNTKLVTLDLSNNYISDIGADELAKGLRFNRTLLSLNLTNNHVGDEGAQKLGEVLSRFALTHEENVERRKLVCANERQKSASPPPSGRTRGERPPSTRSQTNAKKETKKDTKDTKGKKEKEKEDTKGGTKKDKKDINKKASLTSDLKSTSKGGKEKGGKSSRSERGKAAIPEMEPLELTETTNPLLETPEVINGEVMIPGNRTLINLGLSRNRIGEAGIGELLKAVQWQTTLTKFTTGSGTGLMRLSVQKNSVSPENSSLQKLLNLMTSKDPFYKPTARTPDDESASEYSHS